MTRSASAPIRIVPFLGKSPSRFAHRVALYWADLSSGMPRWPARGGGAETPQLVLVHQEVLRTGLGRDRQAVPFGLRDQLGDVRLRDVGHVDADPGVARQEDQPADCLVLSERQPGFEVGAGSGPTRPQRGPP